MKLKGHTDNVKALLLNRDGTQVRRWASTPWGPQNFRAAEIPCWGTAAHAGLNPRHTCSKLWTSFKSLKYKIAHVITPTSKLPYLRHFKIKAKQGISSE